jgi:hypothetical protein
MLCASSFTSNAMSDNPLPLFQRALTFRLPYGKYARNSGNLSSGGEESKIISDLGDSKGSYISNQASDAGASYGMAGELRSRWLKPSRHLLPG